jgi:hypothetical protein
LSSDKRAAWTYAEVAKSVFLLLFATLFRNGLGTRAPGATQRFSFPGEFSPNFDPKKYGFDLYKRFFVEKMAQTRQISKENKFPNSHIFMISYSR